MGQRGRQALHWKSAGCPLARSLGLGCHRNLGWLHRGLPPCRSVTLTVKCVSTSLRFASRPTRRLIESLPPLAGPVPPSTMSAMTPPYPDIWEYRPASRPGSYDTLNDDHANALGVQHGLGVPVREETGFSGLTGSLDSRAGMPGQHVRLRDSGANGVSDRPVDLPSDVPPWQISGARETKGIRIQCAGAPGPNVILRSSSTLGRSAPPSTA